MPTGSDYKVAVVLTNRHEPEGEVATRLLELADEKGYDGRTVEASRGDHDVALSFKVPEEVAEAFNAERADLWPSEAPKIENDEEKDPDQGDSPAALNEDAYAAEHTRAANAARTPADEPVAEPVDKTQPGRKARTNTKE